MTREGGRVFQITDPNQWGSAPGSSHPVSPGLALLGFVGLCLLVGASAAALTAGTVHGWYLSLNRPPGTPPSWIFGPIWGGLYAVIGIAAWLVWRREGTGRALRLWGWQLAANALWAPAFFAARSPLLGLLVILVLLGLILATIRNFRRVQRSAAWLLLPYLIWTGYAAYLNAGFCWLNPV